jgi:hypothetical protein
VKHFIDLPRDAVLVIGGTVIRVVALDPEAGLVRLGFAADQDRPPPAGTRVVRAPWEEGTPPPGAP